MIRNLLLISFLAIVGYAQLDSICNPILKYSKSGAYIDDCDDVYLYCDSTTSTCKYRECSNSDYISGWDITVRDLPTRCNNGTYCPDNHSYCLPTLSIGSFCELLRDDECQGPNTICLNKTCTLKAVPLDGNCGIESTTFVSYLAGGEEFLQTTVRDNCTSGTFCENSKCILSKELNSICKGDRECLSGSCSNEGLCVVGPDVFKKIKDWTWGLIATAIVLFIFIVMISLWFLHRLQSKREHEKRVRFFGDNEEFSKHALLNESIDKHSFYLNPSFNRQSLVYLTTPDYQTSQALSLKNRNSTLSVNS